MQVEDVKLEDYRTLMRSRTPIEVVPKLASSLEDLMSVADFRWTLLCSNVSRVHREWIGNAHRYLDMSAQRWSIAW